MDKVGQYLKALGKSIFQFTLRYPLAIAATVLLVILAIAMAAAGKTFQIGGLLGKLWGKSSQPDPNIRVIPPEDRIDQNGNVILPGQSDDKGFVQSPASIDIKDPGMFSDPTTITIIHPDKGEVVIPLPTGVQNQDVKQVIEITPNTYQIINHDKGVDPKKVLDILNK